MLNNGEGYQVTEFQQVEMIKSGQEGKNWLHGNDDWLQTGKLISRGDN